ncbi:type II toxin-antitoxin system ParD family antitoxin [Devosia sp. LjRoot16]|uniref:type II toxin-antitoxin system ParD family antitoxin n=1 Tax=Devosia sp. LjRoot16 TaxID=3342271 RepID=UPI003ECFF944
MATMNISLPDKMKQWVEEQVATGRYANASDLMRDIIRERQEKSAAIARLQAEIDKGRASGISDKSVDEIFAEARRKAIAALKARDAAA